MRHAQPAIQKCSNAVKCNDNKLSLQSYVVVICVCMRSKNQDPMCLNALVTTIKQVSYSLTSAFLLDNSYCNPGTMTFKPPSTATKSAETLPCMQQQNSDVTSATTGAKCSSLTVGLGHSLELILLLDGIPAVTERHFQTVEPCLKMHIKAPYYKNTLP